MFISMSNQQLNVTYKLLLEELKKIPTTEEEIEFLKNEMKMLIDSTRDEENIKNLVDLLEILDRRDELSAVNIDNLYPIVDKIGRTKHRKLLNNHAKEILKLTSTNPNKIPVNQLNSVSPNDHILPPEVVEILSQNLKDHWKNFARKINVEDWNIDVIDSMDIDTEEKIRQILKVYVQEHVEVCSRGHILNALSELKRNRTKGQVEKIFKQPCERC